MGGVWGTGMFGERGDIQLIQRQQLPPVVRSLRSIVVAHPVRRADDQLPSLWINLGGLQIRIIKNNQN